MIRFIFPVLITAALLHHVARDVPGAETDAAPALRAAAYFKVSPGDVDVHPLCSGSTGVYRACNRLIKGSGALFIRTGPGVIIAPGERGFEFGAALRACGIMNRLPERAVLAARLYLLFSKSHKYGMLIEDPRRFARMFREGVNVPRVHPRGHGNILTLWTRNIDTDRVYRLVVEIGPDGKEKLLEAQELTR